MTSSCFQEDFLFSSVSHLMQYLFSFNGCNNFLPLHTHTNYAEAIALKFYQSKQPAALYNLISAKYY